MTHFEGVEVGKLTGNIHVRLSEMNTTKQRVFSVHRLLREDVIVDRGPERWGWRIVKTSEPPLEGKKIGSPLQDSSTECGSGKPWF